MASEVKAMLLAAGIGSRLRPLTDVLPKCLMPINGAALLGYWLRILDEAGVTDIVVNLHHHSETVREYLALHPQAAHLTLSFEQELLGTGGTLLRHKARFAGHTVLLAHADNLSLFSLHHFAEAHRRRPNGADITMMTFSTDVPEQCGILELDEAGLVQQFHEKIPNPPGNLANAAVYLIEPNVIEFMQALGTDTIDFSTQVLPNFIGRIATFHNAAYHRDIGTARSLALAQIEYPFAAARYGRGTVVGDPLQTMMNKHDGRLARQLSELYNEALVPALSPPSAIPLST